MKISTVLGLGAIGGFLYMHQRRGGTFTFDSLADTARSLIGKAKTQAEELKEQVSEGKIHDVASSVADATRHH